MPRRRTNRHAARRQRPSFPLLDLPPDLQIHVLGYLELQDLRSIVRASAQMRDIYLGFPETLLGGATSYMGAQIQRLMLTTLSIIRSIRSHDSRLGPSIDTMHIFLADNLDTDQQWRILQPGDNALAVLDALCVLDAETTSLVQAYAIDDYGRAYCSCNPGTIPPPIWLSSTERHRIMRAFWRLKLYGVLFYNYADYFDLDLSSCYTFFLDRLCDFEMDEMITAYQFMVRYRRNFVSEWPHRDCPFAGELIYRNRDPFECPHCQGRYLYNTQRNQALWHIVEHRYLGSVGLWADPRVCGHEPQKVWHEFLESNAPNTGWQLFRKYRDEYGLNGETYRTQFRNLGFCFWEKERLEALGFFEEWESE